MRARVRAMGVVLLVAGAVLLHAQAAPGRLVFPGNGWSIAPLEQTTDAQLYQTLMMFLPASESFAPNVNVQIQTTDWSFEEFIRVSRNQFAGAGFHILEETRGIGTATWEYTGAASGYALHWFTAVYATPGRFYVVTATATQSQWASVGQVLTSCVLSFRLEP